MCMSMSVWLMILYSSNTNMCGNKAAIKQSVHVKLTITSSDD